MDAAGDDLVTGPQCSTNKNAVAVGMQCFDVLSPGGRETSSCFSTDHVHRPQTALAFQQRCMRYPEATLRYGLG